MCNQESGSVFCHYVSIWRLVPCDETTVEHLHGIVTKEKGKHHMGAVRVSLANRLDCSRLLAKPGRAGWLTLIVVPFHSYANLTLQPKSN